MYSITTYLMTMRKAIARFKTIIDFVSPWQDLKWP
jgi:hypothetical protein